MPPHYFKGYIEVVTGAILFGLIGIFVKLISDMPLGSIIFYRLLFAIAMVALYLSYCGKFNEITLREKKGYVLLLGVFQAGAMLSYFTAIKYTSVSIAVLLLYTAPVYVIILSPLLLKESITRNSMFALLLSITGVIMIVHPRFTFNDSGSSLNMGIVTGMLSGLFYAMMIVVSRHLKSHYTGTAQAWWAFIVTLLVFLPYSVMVPAGVVVNNLLLLVLFGLVPTAAGAVLYLNGLRLVKAQNASIIGLLEPASAVVFAFIILNEPVSTVTLLGGGLILAGAITAGLGQNGVTGKK